MSDVAPTTQPEQQVSQRPSSGYAYYVFWVMFGINFLNYLDRYVMTGAANQVAKELHFDLSGIGYITSAFLIVYTLCALPVGIWADRARRKDVVAASVVLWSLATATTALATNFWTLFLSRMVLGVGEAGYYPAGTALLSDYFNRARRSRIMSWWSCAQLFGILGGYGLGGTLAGLYLGGWRLAFLLTSIPGLVLAFLMWRVREPRRNQADEEASATEQAAASDLTTGHVVTVPSRVLAQFRSLLRIPTLSVLILMQVFAYFVLGVNTAFLPIYLQQKDTFALSSLQAGLYSGGVIVLAGIVGMVLGGYMADVLNRRHPGARVLVCGIGFLLGAPAFALSVTTRALPIFTIFFVLTALLLTIYTGPCTAATQDVVPSALRASAVSLTMLIAHLLGDAFAPSIVGVLATSFDPTHGDRFAAGRAGLDLSHALLMTCTPALIIAGLIGLLGARWMAGDVRAAEQADRRAREASL
jgi:MFS transporter, Spinster family, sphingosine-1-phosphate transporter